MKLTIEKTVTEEIEIGEFPLYRKDICHFIKICSRVEAVIVSKGFMPGIQKYESSGSIDVWFTAEESNEQEFLEMYHLIQNKIKDVVEPIEKEYPLQLQKAI